MHLGGRLAVRHVHPVSPVAISKSVSVANAIARSVPHIVRDVRRRRQTAGRSAGPKQKERRVAMRIREDGPTIEQDIAAFSHVGLDKVRRTMTRAVLCHG